MGWKDGRMLRHYASIFNTTVFEDIDTVFGDKTAKPTTTPPKPSRAEIEKNDDDLEAFKKLLGI